ncbi:MAG: metal-dependent transcriptional regulator [Bacteroidetes bacterium]|nr:MAG: metal-dependent transcriptional regulator [Bacteroidota bacterium]
MLSITEENYLKQILGHKLEFESEEGIGTNELAGRLSVKPSSVHVMLKKLRDKNLIDYEKYGKIHLTKSGQDYAMQIVRKHRLWETFLYEKLDFTWDEVHEVAEQLEHIQSPKLVEKLDKFLEHPDTDPHGDPIPDKTGKIKRIKKELLSRAEVGKTYKMVAVKDNSAAFLSYLQDLGIGINKIIHVVSRLEFDQSMEIQVAGKSIRVSKLFSDNVFVVLNKKD